MTIRTEDLSNEPFRPEDTIEWWLLGEIRGQAEVQLRAVAAFETLVGHQLELYEKELQTYEDEIWKEISTADSDPEWDSSFVSQMVGSSFDSVEERLKLSVGVSLMASTLSLLEASLSQLCCFEHSPLPSQEIGS